jgi:hypothetical protein
MKIGKYEISSSAIFYVTGEDGMPVSVNAGKDIPMVAIWLDGEPHAFDMKDEFMLPSSAEAFQALVMDSQAAS